MLVLHRSKQSIAVTNLYVLQEDEHLIGVPRKSRTPRRVSRVLLYRPGTFGLYLLRQILPDTYLPGVGWHFLRIDAPFQFPRMRSLRVELDRSI